MPFSANIRCPDSGKGGGDGSAAGGGKGGGAPQAGGRGESAAGGKEECKGLAKKKNLYINFIPLLDICYLRLE